MAIDMSEFTESIEPGLKANSTYKRFFYRFKKDGITKRGILDYTDKQWDKRARVSKAKSELLTIKSKQRESGVNFTENSRLNDIAKIYFETSCEDTRWQNERQDMYKLYCQNGIGRKRISSIRQVDIDHLRKQMERQGHSKQTKNGCSPRTIRKLLLQILKPIMEYAKENRVIDNIPKIQPPKLNQQKKIVENAGHKLATLYTTILSLYKDDPFYRALFLFALYGRRWNEIRTLLWSDINLQDNLYTIRAENSKIGRDQTYELPAPIVEALTNIADEQQGLVFKSPKTGNELYTPKKQLAKLKKASGIPNLTMHYFRHILVSAMGEMGTASTVLSAALGHENLKTVDQFYRTANYTKASKEANLMIGTITSTKPTDDKQQDEKREPSMAEQFLGIISDQKETE